MKENPLKNWTEDIDNLSMIPPLKTPHKKESNKDLITRKEYDTLVKRLTHVEKQISTIQSSLQLNPIRQLKNKLRQLESDIHGNPSGSKTNSY